MMTKKEILMYLFMALILAVFVGITTLYDKTMLISTAYFRALEIYFLVIIVILLIKQGGNKNV